MSGGHTNKPQYPRVFRAFRVCALAFAADETGQATTEYILLLSMVVAGAGALSRAILRAVNNGILLFGAQLERNIQSGRLNANIWSN